ncbi:MAG TPA: ABC transporter substrate-binding protein [Gaiellaceae bacterium]|nr:ABC transporter substrate-binding protein [Gaiellaceae bacterium]
MRKFAVVLALAACAVGVAVTTGSAKTHRVAATQANQLEVFSWWTGGGEAHGLQALIKIWNKNNPTTPFKNETVAGGAGSNAKAVLAQRLAAHKPPDSFQGHAGAELLDYVKAGQLEPIDSVYKQYGFLKVFPKQLVSQITYKGHLYSVPVNIHRANILWFNPSVLKKNGISVPTTWAAFMTALSKCQDAGLTPLALGEAWTQMHLFETTMIATIGPAGWNALWKKGGNWNSAGVKAGLNRFKSILDYTNTDAASLTWQDASKLVADGKACFNIMGDWADGYFRIDLKKTPNKTYGWAAVPGTSGVYDWLSDSFTLPKGAPHRDAAIKWLGFLGSKQAQDTFNPLKGSIPARKDANPKLYDTYLKWALQQWKTDKLAGSLTHGVVAYPAWSTDVSTAIQLFVQTKDVNSFQKALVDAAKKRAT